MNGRRSSTTAPRSRRIGRGPLGILLVLLVPPIGLIYLWRNQVYRTRGRMLLTVLATVELTLLFLWWMPRGDTVAATLPVPASSQLFTAAPESDVLTALSSLEEIARAQTPPREDSESTVIQIQQEQQLIAQQALLDTVVYSVYHNAKYYHADSICNGQTNSRMLTIRDALREGLGPCPDCDPPVYQAISDEVYATQPPEEGYIQPDPTEPTWEEVWGAG